MCVCIEVLGLLMERYKCMWEYENQPLRSFIKFYSTLTDHQTPVERTLKSSESGVDLDNVNTIVDRFPPVTFEGRYLLMDKVLVDVRS